LTVRIPPEWEAALKALAERRSTKTKIRVTPSDLVRIALSRVYKLPPAR
jgi:hypothetical protein